MYVYTNVNTLNPPQIMFLIQLKIQEPYYQPMKGQCPHHLKNPSESLKRKKKEKSRNMTRLSLWAYL